MSPTKQLLRKRFAELQFSKMSNYADAGNSMIPDSAFQRDVLELDTISVHDQAALLLSVAAIARSEITKNPLSLDRTSSLPLFPLLNRPSDDNCVTPRQEFRLLMNETGVRCVNSPIGDITRARTVSIDSPFPMKSVKEDSLLNTEIRSFSPMETSVQGVITPVVSPVTYGRRPIRKHSLRLSAKTSDESITLKKLTTTTDDHANGVSLLLHSKKKLQGEPPKGIRIKKIMRRKFSWKNFPEVRFSKLKKCRMLWRLS
jgi:hypothetical protein